MTTTTTTDEIADLRARLAQAKAELDDLRRAVEIGAGALLDVAGS